MTEEPRNVGEVYRRLPRLLRSHLGALMRFYVILFAVMGTTIAAEFALAESSLPDAVRMTFMFGLLAFYTVANKAAVFIFYLQLAARAPDDYAA